MFINPIRDEFIIAGELTFHYAQWGEKGPPIIFVHGLTANAFSFQAFADDLSRDHRVFAYDLRGRGESDKPETGYSIPIHAADLAELIDELDLDRPIIAGHSLGALIGLYFATQYKDKLSKLILIDAGAPFDWKTVDEQPAWLTSAIDRLGTQTPSFEEYKQNLKAAPFLGPYWNSYFDIYFKHGIRIQNDGSVVSKASREVIFEENKLNIENKPATQWKEVTVPTLLLRAGQGLFTENDQLLSIEAAEAIEHGINNCLYVNFPGLNHYTILFGTEDGPVKVVRRFIEKE